MRKRLDRVRRLEERSAKRTARSVRSREPLHYLISIGSDRRVTREVERKERRTLYRHPPWKTPLHVLQSLVGKDRSNTEMTE